MYIFIYGTLRKGERANDLMEGFTYIGKGSINSRHVRQARRKIDREPVRCLGVTMMMPDHNHFPALSFVPADYYPEQRNMHNKIVGELYELEETREDFGDMINRLDRYEGYPTLYDKNNFRVDLETGGAVVATAYYLPLNKEGLESCRVITSGDWKDRDQLEEIETFLSRNNGTSNVDGDLEAVRRAIFE